MARPIPPSTEAPRHAEAGGRQFVSGASVDDRPVEQMTREERDAVQQGLDDRRAGRLASTEEIRAVLRHFNG